jgi:hypothetical protein
MFTVEFRHGSFDCIVRYLFTFLPWERGCVVALRGVESSSFDATSAAFASQFLRVNLEIYVVHHNPQILFAGHRHLTVWNARSCLQPKVWSVHLRLASCDVSTLK